MTQIKSMIMILCLMSSASEITIARQDEKAQKQKLRSAFRQSLLTADTVYEDIDPSNEEQTASIAPASVSLRGNGNGKILHPEKDDEITSDNDPEVGITLEESTQPIIKTKNIKRRKSVGLTIEVSSGANTQMESSTTTVDYNNNVDEWQSIRIKFEIMSASFAKENEVLKLLEEEMLPNVSQTWSKVLSVIPVHSKLYPSSTTCGSIDVPLRHLRDGIPDSDIIIYLSTQDDPYCGISSPDAYSSICNLDQHHRPIAANIALCNDAIGQQKEVIQKIILHEVGRILGLSPVLFQYYRNPETNLPYGSQQKQITCVDGSVVSLDIPNILQQAYPIHGRKYFEVVTSTVLQVVRNHFNCQMLSGAKLDNSPLSESCFGGFGWDERYYYQETMTSMKYDSDSISFSDTITALSLALLEDSSWYKADFKHAIVPSFGHGAGCGFLEGDCLVSDQKKIPSYSKEFFCSLEESPSSQPDDGIASINKASGCDVSHLAKAECDSSSSSIDDIFDVLKNRGSGVYTLQQTISSLEESDSTYTCPMRTKNAISCLDTTQSSHIIGEAFGADSKCFDTTTSSICLEAKCNADAHKVEIIYQGSEFTCNHPGEKIELPTREALSDNSTKSNIVIECPKIETVCPNIICPANCSGKGMCDYSLDVPICICDDPFDSSAGCWQTS